MRTPDLLIDRRYYLIPRWPAPSAVRAVSTTRGGGHSGGPFESLNLGLRCGDDPETVQRNRQVLTEDLRLRREPRWLRQVHGASVAGDDADQGELEADASVTSQKGVACSVLTADCLPVLLCTLDGERVAAAHAGWRGLAAGVLEETVAEMGRPAETILAWMGPAIGAQVFEVGGEVRDVFHERDPGCGDCFAPSSRGRWLADLSALARRRLNRAGVTRIYGSGGCTYSEPERFFSYRRDCETGRMASLIWIVESG